MWSLSLKAFCASARTANLQIRTVYSIHNSWNGFDCSLNLWIVICSCFQEKNEGGLLPPTRELPNLEAGNQQSVLIFANGRKTRWWDDKRQMTLLQIQQHVNYLLAWSDQLTLGSGQMEYPTTERMYVRSQGRSRWYWGRLRILLPPPLIIFPNESDKWWILWRVPPHSSLSTSSPYPVAWQLGWRLQWQSSQLVFESPPPTHSSQGYTPLSWNCGRYDTMIQIWGRQHRLSLNPMLAIGESKYFMKSHVHLIKRLWRSGPGVLEMRTNELVACVW